MRRICREDSSHGESRRREMQISRKKVITRVARLASDGGGKDRGGKDGGGKDSGGKDGGGKETTRLKEKHLF